MRLQIGPKIGNNKVRLDFKQSPGKPDNTPSYEIDASVADEFVNKYNDQSRTLYAVTAITTVAGTALAVCACVKAKVSKVKSALAAIAGTVAGFGLGVGFSSYKKDQIMKEYNIKEI